VIDPCEIVCIGYSAQPWQLAEINLFRDAEPGRLAVSMLEVIEPSEFDLVVIGTGLLESIVAA
jgi:hypothetical protein